MNEFLKNILTAVLSVAIPTVAVYVVRYLRNLADDTDNNVVLSAIANAVADAVAATSQTFVDSLKASGTFDADKQLEAAAMALELCKNALPPAVLSALGDVYDDVDAFLQAKIEAEVRRQKQSVAVSA